MNEIKPEIEKYIFYYVDACLFLSGSSSSPQKQDCPVYENIQKENLIKTIGYRDKNLISDIEAYRRWNHLQGAQTLKWRSGIKHDCSKVMELRQEGRKYRNGLGELVELEDTFLFPMLKSSELANGNHKAPSRWMLVTQRAIGEKTLPIREVAPKTWIYLQSHAEQLRKRGSLIYKNQPQFSIFGVGDYSFAPWKVAISGLYKKITFIVVGSFKGKPIVLDDTAYFTPFETRAEADFVASLLNSEIAKKFFNAFIFWDAKRPITIESLKKPDIAIDAP